MKKTMRLKAFLNPYFRKIYESLRTEKKLLQKQKRHFKLNTRNLRRSLLKQPSKT